MKLDHLLFLGVLLTGLAGCTGKDEPAGHAHTAPHKHEHQPPHGGTSVVLGEEQFHLEFVRNASVGSLSCYILDAHMENFVRIEAPSFTVQTEINGARQILEFKPVTNPATGEKEGSTSQFEATAPWLKSTAQFRGAIPKLSFRDQSFTNINFRFPEGNE